MARPREFDFDEALVKAMQVFWSKGYEGTSMQDLLAAMGIARGSLYKAFKDKRDIYLQALDLFDRLHVDAAVTMLRDEQGGDGASRVRRFLSAAVDPVAQGNHNGCFLCNAAADQAAVDPGTRDKIQEMLARLSAAVKYALGGDTTQETADALVASYVGLRVMARSAYTTKPLMAVVDTQLALCGLATSK